MTFKAFLKAWAVVFAICVITSLTFGCNASHTKTIEVIPMLQAEAPTFPWDFPSPCGLDSVTCDNDPLEVNLERALADYIVCEYKAPEQMCPGDERGCDLWSGCADESAAVVAAGVAANRYLAGLTKKQQTQESLAQYLAWALGGTPEGYPLSERDMTENGYIE
jgi:hypothetical protein